jgi:predicted RNase H-like HicB family nuclease
MEYIILTFMVQKEGAYWVSECQELSTSSFGSDEDDALDNLLDATEVYLNTLEELGEAHRVLEEKGVQVFPYKPASLEVRRAKFPAGSRVQPTVLSLAQAHP